MEFWRMKNGKKWKVMIARLMCDFYFFHEP